MGESVTVHLRELRQRLVICCCALVVCTAVAYAKIEPITEFFLQPLFSVAPHIHSLVYTNLTEAFIAYIKVALLVGLATAMPVFVFEAWMYVAPGLHSHEKRAVGTIVVVGGFLFLLGLVFAYFAVLPRMLKFFMLFAGDNLQPLPKLGSYLTFVARLAIGFGLAFEIPFLLVMLVRTGLLDRRYLVAKRWYSYTGMATLALLLAAGDLLATALLLVPLVLLYETGVFCSRFWTPRQEEERGGPITKA